MPAWLHALILTLVLLTMLVGLFGLIIPIFPGIVVIWLATLAYGLLTGFNTLAWVLFIVISILGIIGVTIDNVLMNAKAHKEGAAWTSLALGMVGGILGTLFLPPFGGLVAAPLVVWLVEYARQRDVHRAWLTVRGLLIGWGASFVIRFFIGLVMIGLWVLWAINNV
jgi:uncharacterized protein YqgC (DUF456 family)